VHRVIGEAQQQYARVGNVFGFVGIAVGDFRQSVYGTIDFDPDPQSRAVEVQNQMPNRVLAAPLDANPTSAQMLPQ
jgi:hypothetical protein